MRAASRQFPQRRRLRQYQIRVKLRRTVGHLANAGLFTRRCCPLAVTCYSGDHGRGAEMILKISAGIDGLLASLKWTALVVALLLFAQWPLREFVQAYSREANDLGQWLFALFVAGSVTAATRADRHIAADGVAKNYTPRTRRSLRIFGIVFVLIPWTLFVAWSGWPVVRNSVAALERYQDTGNQGYFIIKAALLVMVALMLAQALCDLFAGTTAPEAKDPT